MTDKPHNLLFLPTIKGRSFTKRDEEILRELNPEIKVFPDGTYTINGETSEQINAKFRKFCDELYDSSSNEEIRVPGELVERYCELRRQGKAIEEIEQLLGVGLRFIRDAKHE
jgi:hypothetical protein